MSGCWGSGRSRRQADASRFTWPLIHQVKGHNDAKTLVPQLQGLWRETEHRGGEGKYCLHLTSSLLLGRVRTGCFQLEPVKAGQERWWLVDRLVHHLLGGKMIRFTSYAGRVTRQLIK